MAGETNGRKNISDYVFKDGLGAVSWASKLQKIVILKPQKIST